MGWSKDFVERSNNRELVVTVVGLGYVGLPTIIGFFEAGFVVRGVDTSEDVIKCIKMGKNPLKDEMLDNLIPDPKAKNWLVTTDFTKAIQGSDIIIVTVPTPIDENLKPDLSYVKNAGKDVFDNIQKDSSTIVILESTVYPGVTKQLWLPLLKERNLEIGKDIEIAYCPERFSPGDPNHGVRQVARVIGTDNEKIGMDLVTFYSSLTTGNVSYAGKIEIAEAAKVVENVQRDINIALVNELARIFPELGVDVEDVLTAAESKWNFHRYTPGIGVGGHCIPVDPYYLKQRAEEVGVPAELISAARSVNRSMPEYASHTIEKILIECDIEINKSKILLLGWSYKPRIGDDRESPAIVLASNLVQKGVEIHVFDPYIDNNSLPTNVNGLTSISSIEGFDMIVLHTAHPEFKEINWDELGSRMRNKILYDGRRILPIKKLEKKGWSVYALGKPRDY